jgi:uridine phosphorylase
MEKKLESAETVVNEDGGVYHLGLKPADNLPKNIFLVGDPERTLEVAKYFDNNDVVVRPNREFVTIIGRHQDVSMAVISTGIGPDNIEITAVELHILNEYDHQRKIWKKNVSPLNIIRLGTSGSPQSNISVGSLAVSHYAIGLDNLDQYYPFYSGDPIIRAINRALATTLPVDHYYVSKATPKAAWALIQACWAIGLQENAEKGFYCGITSSAPGFYGPQGRKIGRLSHIPLPNIQNLLAKVWVRGLRVVNNEMESSIMFRIFGELLHYRVGTICAVLVNRDTGEIATPEEYRDSVDRCIQAGLKAMKILNEK